MANKRVTTSLLALVFVASLASSNAISSWASSNASSSNANITSFAICAADCEILVTADPQFAPSPSPPCGTGFGCPVPLSPSPPSPRLLPWPQFPPSPPLSPLLPSSPPSPPLSRSCSKCNKQCRRRGYDYGSCSFRPKCVCQMHSKGTPLSPPIGK